MNPHPSAQRPFILPPLEGTPRDSHQHAAMVRTAAMPRMATVREGFRQHRLASQHRRAWQFYLEHNLFDQARESRALVLEHLRMACQQWRMTLHGGVENGARWRQEASEQGPAYRRSDGPSLG